MASIALRNVTKGFGDVVAIEDVSFDVEEGEFFCLLGPAGAGKTTTLRVIAGLEKPTSGLVELDGARVNDLHPRKRDISILFENLALYPQKTGFENIAFPLRVRRLPEREIRDHVREVARMLQIEHILSRYPRTFSGGERQRVALARAIVRRPQLYLLDEPLSNLDALLRLNMRAELKRLQRDLGQTTIYVTHDQVEAMTMADRICVLNKGRVQQIGSPLEVYRKPRNLFVAGFVGSPPMNVWRATPEAVNGRLVARFEGQKVTLPSARFDLSRLRPGDEIVIGIRPENVVPSQDGPGTVEGRVIALETVGGKIVLDVEVGELILKLVQPRGTGYKEGESIRLELDPDRLHLFDPESGELL